MRSVERWPNIHLKSSVFTTQNFLQYVWPYFNIMHEKVKLLLGSFNFCQCHWNYVCRSLDLLKPKSLHKKWSFPLSFFSKIWPNPQETANLVTFTEEILNGKLHFSCSNCCKLDIHYWSSSKKIMKFHLLYLTDVFHSVMLKNVAFLPEIYSIASTDSFSFY